MSGLTLYRNELSLRAHKVRLVLEEKEIPFKAVAINLMMKENLQPDYLTINPKGLVPALVDDYLHPNTMPVLFGGLARFVWLAKTPEEREQLLNKIPDQERRARQERIIDQGLDAPDVAPYIFILKYPQAEAVFERYPALSDWIDKVMTRPAFDASIKPHVAEERWAMISAVTGNTGPELAQRLFPA